MHIPERPVAGPRKQCKWKDGCEKLAMQNARFCEAHTNQTIREMKETNYLTELPHKIRHLYRSTIRRQIWAHR